MAEKAPASNKELLIAATLGFLALAIGFEMYDGDY